MLPLACFLPVVFAPAPSAAEEQPQTIRVAGTLRTTADGNGFIAPAGWSIKTADPVVVLTAPEGGSHIALIDVAAAKDADAAVAAAWAAYGDQARWPLKLASDRAKRDGWEQIRSYAYELPASEQRRVYAQALRHGDRWTVAIYDMADDVGDTCETQVDLIYQRLWPKGYTRESFVGRTAHKLDGARIETLKQFIDDARRQLDVPGVAIGVVQDGEVVFAGGFGVRQLGKPEPMDADTLFMIASNNKALTTLMLAEQVDAGTFGWDTPVTQLLPSFKLGDADTTRQVRMRHLVCACTGLPRQDMEKLFNSEGATPASVMATLATMRPTSGFGELFQYSNSMAAAAGFVGGHALSPQQELGAAYDRAMQTLVFDPLGMTSTTFDFARALRGNHAMPHAHDLDGNTAQVDLDLNHSVIPSRPDGGAWSNVNDMLRYVRMELANGLLPSGQRYIGEAPLLERRVQQVATGSGTGYGMGLKIDRSWGTPVLHHGECRLGRIAALSVPATPGGTAVRRQTACRRKRRRASQAAEGRHGRRAQSHDGAGRPCAGRQIGRALSQRATRRHRCIAARRGDLVRLRCVEKRDGHAPGQRGNGRVRDDFAGQGRFRVPGRRAREPARARAARCAARVRLYRGGISPKRRMRAADRHGKNSIAR